MNGLQGRSQRTDGVTPRILPRFASPSDHAECRRIHRQLGIAHYLATNRMPLEFRRRVRALYGFIRVPREWVDNPKGVSRPETLQKLTTYRNQLIRGMDGVSPSYAVLRAFCDVAREVSLPIDEPLRFLDAMEQDLHKTRYETYEELEDYMRRSASAIGLMVCDLLELEMDDNLRSCAIDLTQAIHLTGIIRDIGEDLKRERIYIPAEDMHRFSGSEDGLLREEVNRKFVQLLKFEIDRARDLYRRADSGLPRLPEAVQPTAKMARVLYSRILDRIEQRNFDVFNGRVRISAPEELMASVCLLTSKP